MSSLKRLFAVALFLLAGAVGVNWMITPLYHPEAVWAVLDWFMAAAVVVALIVNFSRNRAVGCRAADGPLTCEYLGANVAFYASVALTVLFFSNWFSILKGGMSDSAGQTVAVMWPLIDTLVVLVAWATGCYLWRKSS